MKRTTWNIRASDEKWKEFSTVLDNRCSKANEIIKSVTGTIDERYKEWLKVIEEAAWKTIGKTTIKKGSIPKTSTEVKELGAMKRQLKNEIQKVTNRKEKENLMNEYKSLRYKKMLGN